MSAGDTRFERLYAGLSARERVLLLRESEVTEADERAIRRTMPPAQAEEFSRLSTLAFQADRVLPPVVDDLCHRAHVLGLKWLLLDTIALWGRERGWLAGDASLLARVPIKASEHRRALAEARAEQVSWEEAVAITADARGITDEVAERELRTAVANRRLRSRERGSSATFALGTLHDWLGVEFPFRPPWGNAYEVVPDHAWRREHDGMREAAEAFTRFDQRGPGPPARVLPALGFRWGTAEDDTPWDRTMRLLAEELRQALPQVWGQLLAIERVVGEVAEAFRDGAVLPERLRTMLAEARGYLQVLTDAVPGLVGELAATVIDEAGAQWLRCQVFSE